jgi:hypothetical protein
MDGAAWEAPCVNILNGAVLSWTGLGDRGQQ